MRVELSPDAQAFLGEEVFAHLATLMKDGSPQVTPVWVWTDGKDILINASETSQKVRNLRRDPRVAISVMGLADPLRTLTIRGRVTQMTKDGAVDDINRLSQRYTGKAVYDGLREGVARITIRIEPLSVRVRV